MLTYDIVVIGCGPAGMTAAIYALRAGKKVLLLEQETIGGQIASSPVVENYPGFKSISGSELANNLYEQVTELNGDFEIDKILNIEDGEVKTIYGEDNTYKAKAIIIATGAKYRHLGLPNEENLIGNGIHFCVACDGAFYKDKTVAVIGGGNSALINAITLSKICKKVYVIQIIDKLTGENTLVEKVINDNNIEKIFNFQVDELIGNDLLEGIVVKDKKGQKRTITLDGMFISIGQIPQTDIFKNLIKLNEQNYIVTNEDKETSVKGIFAAGDCIEKKVRQVTTAVNDGTIAALSANKYLEK